jgi:hypothetical protein
LEEENLWEVSLLLLFLLSWMKLKNSSSKMDEMKKYLWE